MKSNAYIQITKAINNRDGYLLDRYDSDVRHTVEWWHIPKRGSIIVIDYKADGAQVFIPIEESNNLQNELTAIENY